MKLDSENSMMRQLKKQVCLFFKEFFQIWVHFRRWILNDNIYTFQNQLNSLVVFFIYLSLLFPGLFFLPNSLLLWNWSIFLFWLLFLVYWILVQQLIEKVEISSQNRRSGFHISRAHHNRWGFIKESEGINPVRRLNSRSTQEKTNFFEHNLLNVLLEGGFSHNGFDKDVNCMTLHFLNLIAKFVHNDTQHRLSQVYLIGEGWKLW